jgi:RhoGAP domain.
MMRSIHCSDVSHPSSIATGIPLCFHFIVLFLFKLYIFYWLFFQDSRWNDVNVVSSLLKLFFRRLPDSLLTSELYPHFIEADKIEDPAKRVMAIKKLVMKHHIRDLLMPYCFFG